MLLSDDKIGHLAHLILREIAPHVVFPDGPDAEARALREIKRVITAEVRVDVDVDRAVRATLASYSRRIPEGSPEWGVLYEKHFTAEMRKRRR